MSVRSLSVALLSLGLSVACTSPPARGSVGALCAGDEECEVGLTCRAGVCAEPASDAGVAPDTSLPLDTGVPAEDTGVPAEDTGVPAEDAGAEDTGAPATDAGRVATYGSPCTCPGSTTGCDSCRPGLLCDVFGEGIPSVARTCVDACVFTRSCDLATQFCDSTGTSGGGCVTR